MVQCIIHPNVMYIYQFPKFFRHYRKYLYLSKAVSTTVTVEASIKSLESADFQILLSSIYWNMTKYFPDKYLTAIFFFIFLRMSCRWLFVIWMCRDHFIFPAFLMLIYRFWFLLILTKCTWYHNVISEKSYGNVRSEQACLC